MECGGGRVLVLNGEFAAFPKGSGVPSVDLAGFSKGKATSIEPAMERPDDRQGLIEDQRSSPYFIGAIGPASSRRVCVSECAKCLCLKFMIPCRRLELLILRASRIALRRPARAFCACFARNSLSIAWHSRGPHRTSGPMRGNFLYKRVYHIGRMDQLNDRRHILFRKVDTVPERA